MPLEWLLYPLLGIVAGLLAGLLGIGGGLVLVVALVWLLPSQGVPVESAMHAALATSLASIVITAAASARAHHRRGSVAWPTAAWLLPGLLVGAWLGSRLATHLDGDLPALVRRRLLRDRGTAAGRLTGRGRARASAVGPARRRC